MAAVSEADTKLQPLLSRAWTLGPKRLGPNILLSNASVDGGSVREAGAASAGSLFDVNQQLVVPVVKRPVSNAILAGIPIADDEFDKVRRFLARKRLLNVVLYCAVPCRAVPEQHSFP